MFMSLGFGFLYFACRVVCNVCLNLWGFSFLVGGCAFCVVDFVLMDVWCFRLLCLLYSCLCC